MGHQIIKQPDGLYAVFSTGVDCWVRRDATREELIDYYAERAAREAREGTAQLLDEVDAAQDVHEVYPFGFTFEEANAISVENGGEDLNGKFTTAAGDAGGEA